MGSENYGLFKRTLELRENHELDSTPPAAPASLRARREEMARHIKPKVDSLAQWFLVYGSPSVEIPPGTLSNFVAGSGKCCGARSQVVNCLKGSLTRAGAVTD